jgi:hypothetical protein
VRMLRAIRTAGRGAMPELELTRSTVEGCMQVFAEGGETSDE